MPFDLVTDAISELEGNSELLNTRGIRNAERKFKFVGEICSSEVVKHKVAEYLPGEAKLVRAIVFDKTPTSNWLVSWHQDKTVAVNEKRDVVGWGPWSVKDGVTHVQPSIEVLENMLTLRIHLDASNQDNGCLKVIANSQEKGLIEQQEIESFVASSKVILCEVNAGGVVLMRPHLLHSSSKSTSGEHRRVLHLEYCNYKLGSGLEWAAST